MLIEYLLGKYMRQACRKHLTLRHDRPTIPNMPALASPCLLYIHIPFCEKLCPYCSFNRIVFEPELASRYFDSLKVEMTMYRDAGFRFNGIYVGGGTPTVMPDRLSEIIGLAKSTWDIKNVSVETNPNHLTPRTLSALKDAGVNRLSVGIQTFDDDLLRTMDRYDKYGSGRELKAKIEPALDLFDVLNLDFIFNFPNQTQTALATDIETVLELRPTQATFYPLMPSSSTAAKISNNINPSNTHQEKHMYRQISDGLSEHYSHASAWCFSSKKGMIDEYIIDSADYAGIGSGSIGFIGNTVYSNTFSVNNYIELLDRSRPPVIGSRHCSRSETLKYKILMKLFQGSLTTTELIQEYGFSARALIFSAVSFLVTTRAATWKDKTLTLTDKGRYYLVVLMREFFTGVNNFREAAIAMDS